MATLPLGNPSSSICDKGAIHTVGMATFPVSQPRARIGRMARGAVSGQSFHKDRFFGISVKGLKSATLRKAVLTIPKCSSSSNSSGNGVDALKKSKTPFGYTRKDVLLIGLGVTVVGVGLKSGLEFAGVDPLQAGNVVQLVMVLGLTLGWISTYIFRVSNKEMTYAQQLRDYENKVMEKRIESLTEAEIEALVEQVEEEKRRLSSGE